MFYTSALGGGIFWSLCPFCVFLEEETMELIAAPCLNTFWSLFFVYIFPHRSIQRQLMLFGFCLTYHYPTSKIWFDCPSSKLFYSYNFILTLITSFCARVLFVRIEFQ